MYTINKARFLIFTYDKYTCLGGMGDYVTSIDTSEDLKKYIKLNDNLTKFGCDFIEVLDTNDFKYSSLDGCSTSSTQECLDIVDKICKLVDSSLGLAKGEKEEIHIKVSDISYLLLCEKEGSHIYTLLEQDKNDIVLDFAGVIGYTAGFFETSLGRYIAKFGRDVYESRVRVINLSEVGLSTLNEVLKTFFGFEHKL